MSDMFLPILSKNGNDPNHSIGYIVGGSLKDNLRVRLDDQPARSEEGSFVIIEAATGGFYGLVTDLQLARPTRVCREQSENRMRRLARCCTGNAFIQPGSHPALMMEVGRIRQPAIYRMGERTQKIHGHPIKTVRRTTRRFTG